MSNKLDYALVASLVTLAAVATASSLHEDPPCPDDVQDHFRNAVNYPGEGASTGYTLYSDRTLKVRAPDQSYCSVSLK